MNSELGILGLYGLLLALTIAIQATLSTAQMGMRYNLSPRDEKRALTGYAARMDRVATNSITAMVLFAPAVLLLAVSDSFSPRSLLAAQVFLFCRVAYVPAYAFGISGVRSALWFAGFAVSVALYLLWFFGV